MVLKIYCDRCGKQISLVDVTPGAAYDDPGVGSSIALKIDEKAWSSMELCREHADEFERLWDVFRNSDKTGEEA